MTADVIVIGGGPAGMMAAGVAAKKGKSVILLERNDRLGKKLFITGKGRCNLTNDTDVEGLLNNTPGNPYFLYSAFYGFCAQDTMAFFEELGVPLVVERGNRVFPRSQKSGDIVRAMKRLVEDNGVKVIYNARVSEIICEDKRVKGVRVGKKEYLASSVILATGGKSYQMTGSSGDGYRLVSELGHSITDLHPSLVPLKASEKWCRALQGLSLKNVAINAYSGKKKLYSDFGEMMFTHFGVTGPVILSASRYILDEMKNEVKLVIDLKPALSESELNQRLLRDFEKYSNKAFKNALDDLLPQKLIPVIIELSKIDSFKKVNVITKEERLRLLKLLKALEITIYDTNGYDEAVVTSGGVCVDEINPSTMQSKIIEGLFFAGEIIDVDSLTGGFNLQIAFSTGFLAGNNC